MNSGQHSEVLKAYGHKASPRLACSTRSAEVLLVVLIFLSLHFVALYDWVLSRILNLAGRLRRPSGSRESFETTHLSRSVARRLRPIE